MHLKEYSPITWVVERFFAGLRYLPPQGFMHLLLKARGELDPAHVGSAHLTAVRARSVEYFVMAYLVLDAAAFASLFARAATLIAVIWSVLRIVDVVQVTVNLTVFDALRRRKDSQVSSRARLTVLAFLNYIELAFCYAVIYSSGLFGQFVHGSQCGGPFDPWDGLYFSMLTQLTVSYGDVLPAAGLRVIAPIQVLTGLVFVVLVFARIVTSLPPIKDVISHETRRVVAKTRQG